ncbi:VanZ family protein [Polaromonas sp.]|uniref:VanZ family protein n=1 Tax=Polaromonas sp. TaxID=1869339 RepID=UPI0032677483
MTVILASAGLYVLGTQAFAMGLFPSPWDKLAHVITFAWIGGAFGLATGKRGWPRVFYCIAGALLIGITDEWHQAYLPGRTASWSDLLADAAGGALAAAALSWRHWLIQRRI